MQWWGNTKKPKTKTSSSRPVEDHDQDCAIAVSRRSRDRDHGLETVLITGSLILLEVTLMYERYPLSTDHV